MPNLFDSCLPMTRHRSICALTALGAVLGALALSGCASEEAASRFLVEPDRYVLYSCLEIATASQSNMNRQRELEALMTKAGTDTGGQIASSMAYRPEYSQLRGEMVQLHKAAVDKNCRNAPGAAAAGVGAPGAAPGPARMAPSDQIVR
jgi:hypothetical protein